MVDTVIRNKLDALIENLPDYSIKYQDIKVGLFYQNIEISDIEILPKKAQPDSLSSQLSIFFKIKSLHINEIGVGSLLFNKTVKIDHILFDNCTVMSVKKSTSNLTNVVKKPMHIDANKIQLSRMNAIHIEALKFVDLSYELYDLSLHEKSQRVLYIDPVCFELHGIHLNKNIDDALPSKSVLDSLIIPDISMGFNSGNYKLSLKNFKADFFQNSVSLENLELHPTNVPKQLAKKYKFSTEIYNASIDNLVIVDVGFKGFLKNHKIVAEKICVSGMNLNIYKDKNKPENTSKIVKLPHIQLKNTKTKIDIKQMNIGHSSLKIQERVIHKDTVMEVSFSEINGNIRNITNQKVDTTSLTASFKAKLMGKAPINVHLSSSLSPLDNKLYVKGKVGALKFKVFDRVLFPALGLKILKGQLDGMDFKLVSDGKISEGRMTMYYHDLKASVLRSKSITKEDGFLSFIANGLARNSNPNKRGKVKVVTISSERKPHKGLGNHLWRSLQNGIVNTISPFGKRARKNDR